MLLHRAGRFPIQLCFKVSRSARLSVSLPAGHQLSWNPAVADRFPATDRLSRSCRWVGPGRSCGGVWNVVTGWYNWLMRRLVASASTAALWYLALSGLRRGELPGLKWSDIDLEAGTISVERGRVAAGSGIVVEGAPKTLSSRRTLPLDDGLVAVLRRASARYAQERLALGAAHTDSGYVAVNEVGEPYTPDTLTRKWRKLTKAAGVKAIRLHDARHSCGTALHLRGVPLAVIAKWLCHADAETTARIYAHSQQDALKAASLTLGEVVTPGH
jgi:integrase